MAVLQGLIDKQDSFEIVRDQIAQLLADEVANQMALAVVAAKDPEDWNLRIYAERSNPWEQFLNDVEKQPPIVSVMYDNSSFDGKASTISERQKCTGLFNIDVYASGQSQDDGATGHVPGDYLAAIEAHRATRLVRNILMASQNVYIGFPAGLIWRRWISSITSFQPPMEANTVQQIVATRIAFQVDFSEESPQYEGQSLCEIGIDLKRSEDGLIIAQAEYDYT